MFSVTFLYYFNDYIAQPVLCLCFGNCCRNIAETKKAIYFCLSVCLLFFFHDTSLWTFQDQKRNDDNDDDDLSNTLQNT